MFVAGSDVPAALFERLDDQLTSVLVRLIGSSYRPGAPPASHRVLGFIGKLASIPTRAATVALQELSSDANLRPWRAHLTDAAYRQNAVRREAGFRHCRRDRVLAVLDNLRPANAADLAALTVEALGGIARHVRHGDASDWRKYWNVDARNRPRHPKPEGACRDYLMRDLAHHLARLDVDVCPETRHGNDRRSDIGVSHGSVRIPVEVKRSCHRRLWSAVREQLIANYALDPRADGHGIYLVFWFGDTEGCRPMAGHGPLPRSAADLEEQLLGTLSADEKLRITIRVIDVSKPST